MSRGLAGGEEEVIEPIYGATYLPRKFKIAVAVPPLRTIAHEGFSRGIAVLNSSKRF
jgi:sulfite reductase beta subunit-like hemoprotein